MLKINEQSKIVILSGEGTVGTFAAYKGVKTARAIKTRLTKESCHGDRWAKAYMYLHDNDMGQNVYADIMTGEMVTIAPENISK